MRFYMNMFTVSKKLKWSVALLFQSSGFYWIGKATKWGFVHAWQWIYQSTLPKMVKKYKLFLYFSNITCEYSITYLPIYFTFFNSISNVFFSLNEDIPVAIFMSFASEGNNAEDGISLAKYLNNWVNIIPGNYKVPPSWASFYGGPPPTAIYNWMDHVLVYHEIYFPRKSRQTFFYFLEANHS